MGLIFSYILGHGRADDPDEVTGLTSRDKYLLRTTWNEARSDPVQLGVGLLVEFLNKHPEYIKMFPFRNLPRERFAEDKKFQAHCANIIYTLSAIVESLNDTDLLVQMLLKSGESHGRRKVPAKAYWELKPIVMKHIEERAPRTFTTEARATWDKTIDVVFKTIISALDSKEDDS